MLPIFQLLRKVKIAARKNPSSTDLSVGIITNSDDRIPSVLSSLGLTIGLLPREHAGRPDRVGDYTAHEGEKLADIDFVVLSYVGSTAVQSSFLVQ